MFTYYMSITSIPIYARSENNSPMSSYYAKYFINENYIITVVIEKGRS